MPLKITNDNTAINQEVLDGATVIKTLAPGAFITVRDVTTPPPQPSSGTLAPAVAAWNTAHASGQAICGGLDSLTGVSATLTDNDGTYFSLSLTEALRRLGSITAVRFNFSVVGSVKMQLWRRNSDNTVLTLVEQTASFTPAGTDERLHVFSTPLTLGQPGDVPGIWMDGASLRCKASGGTLETGWVTGHPTSITMSAVTYKTSQILGMTFYGPPPFIAAQGDSIDAGHGSPFYRPHLDGGPSGDQTGEPLYHIRAAVSGLTSQNFAKGSMGWEWSAANVSKMAAVTPRVAIFGAGINDLARIWSAVSADMAACKAGLPSGAVMMVREMTADNAAATGAVAARNDLTASWCAANGAVLIPMHDAMAQIRTSTGLLEDLKASYDCGDGIHHNLGGKQKMAEMELAALDAYNWAA